MAQTEKENQSLLSGTALALDATGKIFITGWTTGDLAGENRGEADVFLTKYDADGQQLWIRQFGSEANDFGRGVAVDEAGNVFVVGSTGGDLASGNNVTTQAFLAKFDTNGEQVWLEQFGTYDRNDGEGVAVDATGNLIVAGTSRLNQEEKPWYGAFLMKFDTDGHLVWQQPLNDEDYKIASDIAVDASGHIFVTGGACQDPVITGPVGTDVFVAKYDGDGRTLWTRAFGGVMIDAGYALDVDEVGNVYVTGMAATTFGVRDDEAIGPSVDAFLAKYSSQGEQQWIKQFGARQGYIGSGVAVDHSGHALVVGSGDGAFGTDPMDLPYIFIVKYDPDGQQVWAQQFGTEELDQANDAAIGAANAIYTTGYFGGQFVKGDFQDAGHSAFLAKYTFNGKQIWLQTFGSSLVAP